MVPWFDQAVRLWLEGYRDADIARQVGISREWVRRQKHLFPERPWVTRGELGKYARKGKLLTLWEAKGWITRSPSGLFLLEEVKAIPSRLRDRSCQYPDCPNRIGNISISARFCADCRPKVQRYNYPFRSQEAKQKFHAQALRWRIEHPEQWRKIQRRATEAYKSRQREADGQLG